MMNKEEVKRIRRKLRQLNTIQEYRLMLGYMSKELDEKSLNFRWSVESRLGRHFESGHAPNWAVEQDPEMMKFVQQIASIKAQYDKLFGDMVAIAVDEPQEETAEHGMHAGKIPFKIYPPGKR